MPHVVEEFKKEREAVSDLLTSIRRAGVHNMEGRNLLMGSKDLLLKHLGQGIDELYPGLRERAEADPDLKSIIGDFEKELREISDFCVSFFDKYSMGGGGIDFFQDFEKLKSVIESRMEEEEIND